jgi:hypothetical protein
MSEATDLLAREFVCSHCGTKGGQTQELAMSGTGLTRLLEIQPYRYTFVSCTNCGYTEVFNLDILEGRDDLGTFLDALFMD